jgi:cyclopropane fatty-acyl-phospholipid synthase-like methyltransferase
MIAADFEARYRSDPDPWNYLESEYERAKYRATLDACGRGPFGSALELGGSVGVFSELLAPRCARLTTVDFSPTAAGLARARLRAHPQARVVTGAIPEALPAELFDLVIASEILYYLSSAQLGRTLAALESRMIARARLVCVHWRPTGPDRPLTATEVHAALRAQPCLSTVASGGTDEYLLDVLERR